MILGSLRRDAMKGLPPYQNDMKLVSQTAILRLQTYLIVEQQTRWFYTCAREARYGG